MAETLQEMTSPCVAGHKIYDAVHGFIRFNEIERKLIHSEPFQRLHHLHQLGIAFLVYPGATHTRFEHSLGTMELATRIFSGIARKSTEIEDSAYWLQVIRLAALCHDLGHLPFSHDAEEALLDEGGHEKWTLNVIQGEHLLPIWEEMKSLFPGREVVSDVIKMAVGEKKLKQVGAPLDFSPLEKVLSQVITGDFFGADRMDYLLRDAQCTGVSYGLFDHHQMIEMLCILSDEKEGLTLGVEEDGIASCEALLLARHFMHQRVYQYSSVKAHKFHLARFLKAFYAEGEYLDHVEGYLSLSDHEILAALRKACKEGQADAIALLQREKRYRAIAIPEGMDLSSLGIPQDAYEVRPAQASFSSPDFPVLTRSSVILPASHFTQITIQSKPHAWVYIEPAYEKALYLFLEKRG